MLKAKNAVKKNKSPAKSPKGAIVKAKAIAQKNEKSKNIKTAISPKVIKEIVEKDPLAARKRELALLNKKPLDEATLKARKEQKKQKKKLKAAAAKAAKKAQVQQKIVEATTTSPKEKTQANGVATNKGVATVVTPKQAKKDKKKLKKDAAEGKEKYTAGTLSPEKTVFVGNLPTNTKRIQIIKLFASCGPVSAIRLRTASGKVLFKHKARKESGSLNAFITLQDADAVAKALEFNGVQFKDNHLRVTKTDPAETIVDPKRTVFVGNLKYSANDEKLRQIFSSCGEIDYVRTLQDSQRPGCNGVAFVYFKEPDAVGLALELNGTILDDRPIHVERYSVSKLGAKSKRDSEIQKTKGKAPNKGKAMKKGKFQQKGKSLQKGGKSGKKDSTSDKADGALSEKKKKSEFRGAKSQLEKKKSKKKIPTGMKKLAMKIAPRSDD